MKRTLTTLLLLLAVCTVHAQPADYVWRTPSRDSSESMPCGGGDTGMNVWVEGGNIFIYMSRSGAYDQYNTLLKQGRLRIQLGHGISAGADFRQTLRLNEGYVEIEDGDDKVVIWADVHAPVIHIETESRRAIECGVSYENWRYQPRALRKGEGKQNSLKWSKYDGSMTAQDTVRVESESSVMFFHRNPEETVFDRTVAALGMTGVKEQMWNPLANLVSGGVMECEGMKFIGTSKGKYADTDFRAWNFQSKQPARKHSITVTLHTAQTASDDEWRDGLAAVQRATAGAAAVRKAREKSREWWRGFWQRSWIESDSGEAATLARNYTLFRYMLGCNAYGRT